MKRIQNFINAREQIRCQNQMKFIDAIKEDDEPTIRRLLEEGDVIFNHPLPIGTDDICATYPLCVAAFYGSMKTINLLIDYGADINYEGDEYRPIFWALYSIHASVDSICLLLERGATSPSLIEDLFSFERPDREVKYILHFMLLNKIVIPEQVVKIIMWKFLPNCLPLFKLLFSITKNPNIVNKNGDTILFAISNLQIKHSEEIIHGLIKLGVDPAKKNYYNFTASDCATNPRISQLLLEY